MGDSEHAQTKLIRYRGGLVTFRIPKHWQELYVLDGGGEFHPDTADGRSLRLHVTTAQSPQEISQSFATSFAKKSNPEATLRELPSGSVCAKSIHETEDDGEQVITHAWHVYGVVPPYHIRVALFTYTMFASLRASAEVLDELAILDREIMNVAFAAELRT